MYPIDSIRTEIYKLQKPLIKLLTPMLLATMTTGCATTSWEGHVKVGGSRSSSGEIKVDGSIEVIVKGSSLVKPITSMFAQVVSWTDYEATDFSSFVINISDSGTETSLTSNPSVKLNVISGGVTIGSRSFNVIRVNNSIKFANPTAVKQWGEQFIGYADSVNYELGLKTINVEDVGSLTVSQSVGGVAIASSSVTYHRPTNDHRPPTQQQ